MCTFIFCFTVKLILDWIKSDINVLNSPGFKSRLQIWPGLCKLLNGLSNDLNHEDCEFYSLFNYSHLMNLTKM